MVRKRVTFFNSSMTLKGRGTNEKIKIRLQFVTLTRLLKYKEKITRKKIGLHKKHFI
jgi:hypothetical protein